MGEIPDSKHLQIHAGMAVGDIVSLQNLLWNAAMFVKRQPKYAEQVILTKHGKTTSGTFFSHPFLSLSPSPMFGTVTFTPFQPQGPERLLK